MNVKTIFCTAALLLSGAQLCAMYNFPFALSDADNNNNDTILNKALFEAIRNGYKDRVQELLSQGAFVNATFTQSDDYVGITPLHWASHFNFLPIAELLIEHGADVNASAIKWGGQEGISPLHNAAIKGYIEIGKLLIKSGANVNGADSKGWTSLHCAAARGHLAMVQTLLNNGTHVNSYTLRKASPLTFAIKGCHHPVVKELIKAGAFFRSKREEIVKTLTQTFAEQPIVLDAILEPLKKVQQAIKKKSRDELKEALLYALAQRRQTIVLYLLKEGTSSLQESIKALEKLISNASTEKHCERYGNVKKQLIYRLPLLEQMTQREDVREMLIPYLEYVPSHLGVKIDPNGVLLIEVAKGTRDTVLEALNAGANPNAVTQEGTPALALAVAHPDTEESAKIVNLLLERGALPTEELLVILCTMEDFHQRKLILMQLLETLKQQGNLSKEVQQFCEQALTVNT